MKKSLLFAAILTAAVAQSLAQNAPKKQSIKWDDMDLGPFQSGCFKIAALGQQVTAKGIAIKVGTEDKPATVLFDTELLRVTAAWTGGFIEFPRGRGGLEGQIAPVGDIKFSTTSAPGWSTGDITADPRKRGLGNLPDTKWHGLHLNGGQTVLNYSIGKTAILETHSAEPRGDTFTFVRSLQLAAGAPALTLLLADAPGAKIEVAGSTATITKAAPGAAPIPGTQIPGDKAPIPGTEPAPLVTTISLRNAPAGAKIEANGTGRIVLKLPAGKATAAFQIATTTAPKDAKLSPEAPSPAPNFAALTKPGAGRWGKPLLSPGKLGTEDAPYVSDDITPPDDNPFKSWIRPGGHDFFPDGTCALVNISGDVWIIRNLDAKLDKVTWQRFATGLFQPLGVKVVDGKIYVLGRDQITRLHDLNGDGEADHYENFNNDSNVTENYHEFALDLQTDSKGNFYYAKGAPWTPDVVTPHQGTIIRVSKDGTKSEVVATGLRAPNGMGMGPGDTISVSDNQGHWMPANRLNMVKPGGFYGMVPAAHRELTFKDAEGKEFKVNPSDPEARAKFPGYKVWGSDKSPVPLEGMDQPLVWMPQKVDNSPGGEVWVSGKKWGPWEGRMLHMSYGHCWLYGVMIEKIGDVQQGAIVRFPWKFNSGIMRGKFAPQDGQLYMSGLNVWQSDGAKLGCFHRVRYTGKPVTMPLEYKTSPAGITFTFSNPLDPATAGDPGSYSVERWNYRWTGAYGSPDVSAADPTKTGRDLIVLNGVKLSPDKKSVTLEIPDMAPVNQFRVKYSINAADGSKLDHELHGTIHKVGK